ncbi:MAG: STAS domain-containing protein [Calditrichaceae bacterium]|nr:STAS domain-containing protein [Calditrichaceae bacterium]MBN2709353.1 STAS domain-containing protein [Calditrichaceae bacterium]RQV94687.1 MAG: anti-sigma factor antagonist [Calditrichota bacterium]
MEGIQVSTEIAGSRNQLSIIKVGGYIDTTTSSELERALDALLKQGRFLIIVDLGNVDYISSAGWGIFISEIKSIRENGGDLKLVRMVPDVYEIFELLEFHHILDVYDTVDEAINKFEMLEAAGKPVAKEISLPKPEEAKPAAPAEPQPGTVRSAAAQPAAQSQEATKVISIADMSMTEKIKAIVKENPSYGAIKIKKELNTAKYGYIKAGWFEIRSQLSMMKLNSRAKRYEYATSA